MSDGTIDSPSPFPPGSRRFRRKFPPLSLHLPPCRTFPSMTRAAREDMPAFIRGQCPCREHNMRWSCAGRRWRRSIKWHWCRLDATPRKGWMRNMDCRMISAWNSSMQPARPSLRFRGNVTPAHIPSAKAIFLSDLLRRDEWQRSGGVTSHPRLANHFS